MESQSSDGEIMDLEIRLNPFKGKECFFNWVSDKFNANAANDRMERRQCKKKCSNFKECDYCSYDGDWRADVHPTMFFDRKTDDLNKEKGYFHKFVAFNGEIAYLEAFVGGYEKAEQRLNYVDRKIDEYCRRDYNECDVEYVDGFRYLSAMLQIFIQFRKDKESLDLDEFLKIESFDALCTPAKIAVLSVKFNFYKETRETLHIKADILRKLIQLDKSNPSWYEKLGIHLRCIKKDAWKGQGRLQPPDHEETSMFLHAYKMKPNAPKFFVSLCRNIAEILKAKRYKSLDDVVDIECTRHLFNTVGDTLDFMKKNTNFVLEAVETLEKNRDTAKDIATWGEVFSVSLPMQFIDLDLAERCILSAIKVSPTCSKANHRMGLFQWVKRGNFESALEYLTSAVESKNENFYAVIDWLQLLLHKADEQEKLLEDVFDLILSKDYAWTWVEKARLLFLKGCYLFIVNGNETETINSWVSAYDKDKTSRHFVLAFSEAHRYKWDKSEWNIERICAFLKKFAVFNITKRMLADVEAAKKRQQNLQPLETLQLQKKVLPQKELKNQRELQPLEL